MPRQVWFKTAYVDVNTGTVTREITINGERYLNVNGSYTIKESDCYDTREALINKLTQDRDAKIERYMAEITDVESLIKFMYEHTIAPAEEYTDHEARDACREMAKRLLNIELDP